MRPFIPAWVRVPLVFFTVFGIVEYFIDSGDKPAFIEQPVVLLYLLLVLIIILAVEGIVAAIENILYSSLDEKAKLAYDAKRNETPAFIKWIQKVYKKLAGGKPMEEEHEIILDHNYDGIKELDNSLPPWWLWSFYISIVFAAIYLVRFHVLDGDSQFDELDKEYAIAEKEIEEYKKTAKDLVDFNTVQLLTDVADLKSGEKIFMDNCIACHKADGGGGIGPNLTDQYWVLGGGINNIFKTISEGGRDGKGMIAWKQSLKPSEIAQVASYVLTFQGTTPAEPKEPEGELWVSQETNTASDTTTTTEENTVKVDSTTVN